MTSSRRRRSPGPRAPTPSQMVEFLLARGAPTNLPDDEPWATPLAWAERRHHAEIVSLLRRHGAH